MEKDKALESAKAKLQVMADEHDRFMNSFMWRATNFMLWRWVRLVMLGISLAAAVYLIVQMFGDPPLYMSVIDFVLVIGNAFAFGLNLRNYDRSFHNGR